MTERPMDDSNEGAGKFENRFTERAKPFHVGPINLQRLVKGHIP